MKRTVCSFSLLYVVALSVLDFGTYRGGASPSSWQNRGHPDAAKGKPTMTKSIFTLVGVLVTFAAIMAGLAGAFELTAGLAVALLFVWFIFAIFFARFGGFKPFFAAEDDTFAEGAEGAFATDSGTRRLISVGAEVDESQSLFGERGPISTDGAQARTPIFDKNSADDSELHRQRTSLFGEALSDRLEAERLDTDTPLESRDRGASGIKWADPGLIGEEQTEPELIGDEEARSEVVEAESEATAKNGIVVDDDPDWVGRTVDEADIDDSEEDAAEGELQDLEDDAEEDLAVDDEQDDVEPDVIEANIIEIDEVEADILEIEADAVEIDVIEADILEIEAEEEFTEDLVVEISDSGTETSDNVDLEDIDAEKLAAAFDSIAPADASDPPVQVDYVSEPVVTASTGLSVGSGTELPVVVQTPAPLELHKYTSSEIMAVVKTQEGHLVDTLIDEGVLSTEGPLTDKDIRTMVFVAVSSTELIEVLTEGQKDAVALNGGGNHALESGS